jgi:DNA polymerase elongation subunit (family B)
MLVDFSYIRSSQRLALSIVDSTGVARMKYYNWSNPHKFVNCPENDPDKDPKFKSWEGKAVKKIPCGTPDRYAVYEYLDALPEKDKKIIFDYNEPEIYFIDIEVRVEDSFPEAYLAETEVLAISIVYENKIRLMGLKELTKEMQQRILDKTNLYFKKFDKVYEFDYMKYECEFDMLQTFFEMHVPRMSCISGWNVILFDWAFLLNRAKKVTKEVNGEILTIDYLSCSPTRKIEEIFDPNFKLHNLEMPRHKLIFDYMQLYEAFDQSIKVKESSSLDYVANKLVGVSKIKYNGSLQKLYDDDFEMYMYYNAVDSVLVQKVHEARNYISIVYSVSSLAKIRALDVIKPSKSALASLAITEGVLRNRFRDMDNIVLFSPSERESHSEDKMAGGYVKEPITGMSRFVVCFDFSSLYPTAERQFFIAPENYVGKQSDDDVSVCTNGKIINSDEHVVCVNKEVFRKRRSPTIVMLEDVFAERKKAKKIMFQKMAEYAAVMEEIKELEKELD